MRTSDEKQRKCPTCGGDTVKDLGLRDYSSWAFGNLPGKVGGTDVDRVIERHGYFLCWEFKPTKYVPRGQSIFFDALAQQDNWVVYVCVDNKAKKDEYTVGRWVPGKGVVNWWLLTKQQCAELELIWWDEVETAHQQDQVPV